MYGTPTASIFVNEAGALPSQKMDQVGRARVQCHDTVGLLIGTVEDRTHPVRPIVRITVLGAAWTQPLQQFPCLSIATLLAADRRRCCSSRPHVRPGSSDEADAGRLCGDVGPDVVPCILRPAQGRPPGRRWRTCTPRDWESQAQAINARSWWRCRELVPSDARGLPPPTVLVELGDRRAEARPSHKYAGTVCPWSGGRGQAWPVCPSISRRADGPSRAPARTHIAPRAAAAAAALPSRAARSLPMRALEQRQQRQQQQQPEVGRTRPLAPSLTNSLRSLPRAARPSEAGGAPEGDRPLRAAPLRGTPRHATPRHATPREAGASAASPADGPTNQPTNQAKPSQAKPSPARARGAAGRGGAPSGRDRDLDRDRDLRQAGR
eukprot:scaffold603_cov404-Prasinococcus_capsulatus_cf.AAC.40